ncbi:glutamine cyclotransferase [Ulvibacter sp. MAR_2010_11]|uniref:glutaminyl-peptide cyclotransferase n=1 Tax=Ulvibacter sp. MAR_2010_11 TaxID=1250229 RepID=UPI000C2C9E5A|nr:glutaminyl-peptide cyclotransferase [Ulvibacter sp. MAR_2010_11]PKA84588.1 glutamine cyclotransferase [Ulvibacter sp. MAR_2010_11]
MKIYKQVIVTALVILSVGCGNKPEKDSDLFAIEIKEGKKAFTVSDVPMVSIKSKKNKAIEAVKYTLDGLEIASVNGNKETSVNLSEKKLGIRTIEATITSEGNTYSISKNITLLASTTPKLYTYTILEIYPHDIEAYTQGLEFHNDTLYESTGQYKESTLRKTNYTTGSILKKVALQDQYFAEGLTIVNDKIFQLTWRENTGFIYDLRTMDKKGSFVYGESKEGWGLCNNGSVIFKSDGTEKIWTLNAETLAEEGYIEMYTNTSKIPKVNELEWVDGKIYANIYQQGAIAIVNPENGAVEGVIDLTSLKDKVTQHDALDVLNGIAYKGEKNILYVTGKNWDRLFKIQIIEK